MMSEVTYGQRITYMASGIPNVMVTRETFMLQTPSGTKHYKGYINEAEKKFIIRDEKTTDVVVEGTGTSLHKIKIKLKDQLYKLGVKFEEETRKPKVTKED